MDLKQVGECLQAARLWISHAEEAFDKKKDIRGELDLLLAQAELKRVREVKRSCQWRYKYSFLRQITALGLAALMVTAGIGGAYWLINQGEKPKAMPQVVVYHDAERGQEVKSEAEKTEKTVPSAVSQAQIVISPEVNLETPAHQTVSHEEHQTAITAAQQDKPKENAAPDKIVSPDEMQKLIRVAGKSLRAQ